METSIWSKFWYVMVNYMTINFCFLKKYGIQISVAF